MPSTWPPQCQLFMKSSSTPHQHLIGHWRAFACLRTKKFFFWRRWQIPKDGGNGTHPWNFLTGKHLKKQVENLLGNSMFNFTGVHGPLAFFFLCDFSVLFGVETPFRSHKKQLIAVIIQFFFQSSWANFWVLFLRLLFLLSSWKWKGTLNARKLLLEGPLWEKSSNIPRFPSCKSACWWFFSDDVNLGTWTPGIHPDHLLAARVGLLGWRIPFI